MGTVTQQQVLSITQPLIGGITISGGLALAIQLAATNGGAVHNLQDISTLFQDSAGTTPVTSDGDPVGLVVDSSGNGLDASQATAGSRPTYRVDARGFAYLEFDGTDDFLTIPGSDSALKFMHDGTGGSFIGAFSVDKADDGAIAALVGNRPGVDIGFVFRQVDTTAADAQVQLLVNNGVSNIVNISSANGGHPRNQSFIALCQYSVGETPNANEFIDGVSVASGDDTGTPSASNSANDIQIGATGDGTLPLTGKWYGNTFIGAILTPQQAFELTRYYAQISGATL